MRKKYKVSNTENDNEYCVNITCNVVAGFTKDGDYLVKPLTPQTIFTGSLIDCETAIRIHKLGDSFNK